MKIIKVTIFMLIKEIRKNLIKKEAINHLIKFSGGDARNLINALELAIGITEKNSENEIVIDLSVVEDSIQKKNPLYDKRPKSF